MALKRQHKFIDTSNNEIDYYLIEYTDESDYADKVLKRIEEVKNGANAVYEDTGEYLQIS